MEQRGSQMTCRIAQDDWSSNISSWRNCEGNHKLYASESIELACKYAYPNATAGSTLNGTLYKSKT
ncbi:hypothetical protein Scep_011173 [Stephania cephalantha]|uniref:Aspergillus nuclease S1 n=1 Tax=Stephania cephalantha TaxID=152367 RepID=A0AAP0JDN6_9MAGN